MFKLPFAKKEEPPKNLFEKGKLGEAEEKPKRERKKKEALRKPWTLKDRIIVAIALLLTMGFGVYFWLKGEGQVPVGARFNFKLPSFEETVILEK